MRLDGSRSMLAYRVKRPILIDALIGRRNCEGKIMKDLFFPALGIAALIILMILFYSLSSVGYAN